MTVPIQQMSLIEARNALNAAVNKQRGGIPARQDEIDLAFAALDIAIMKAAAALVVQGKEGWQPIETCPREADTDYIFWCVPRTDDEIRAVNSGILVPCPPPARRFVGEYGHWPFQQKATHWMPLPAAPQTETP